MHKIKAKIIIKGEVQEAGYRAYVMKAAQKLGLVGYVENLPDGNVEVVSEGEKENIERFIDIIKIKDETIDVESIETKYENATGEFDGKGFIPKITDPDYEMFQGYATAGKYFKIMFKKQDKALGKQDKMLEKQDRTIDTLKDFRDTTKQSFTDMGNRYGSIQDELVDTRKELAKLVRYIGVLVEEHMKKKEK